MGNSKKSSGSEKRTKDNVATEPQQNAPSVASTEEKIRERAYQNWQTAGCPSCDGVEFWLQAEAQLAAESRPSQMSDRPEIPS